MTLQEEINAKSYCASNKIYCNNNILRDLLQISIIEWQTAQNASLFSVFIPNQPT